MLKTLSLIITFLVVTSVYADAVVSTSKTIDQNFCDEVATDYENGGDPIEFDGSIEKKFKNYPIDVQTAELYRTVSNMKSYKSSRVAAVQACKQGLNSARGESLNKFSKMIGFAKAVNDEKYATEVQEKTQQNACDDIKDDLLCTVFDSDIDPALKDVTQFVLQKRGCECVVENMKRRYRFEPLKLEEMKQTTTKRVQGTILGSFGEKFFNDYAMNMEDVGYFNTNSAKFFGSDEKNQNKAAEEYQCSDPSKYQAAIDTKCRSNKISDEEKQERLNGVFSAFGSRGDRLNIPLSDRLNELNQKIQILNYEPGASVASTTSGHYARNMHDQKRFGLSRKDNSSVFLNSAVLTIMKDKTLSAKMNQQLAEGIKPIDAIVLILQEQAEKSSRKFLDNFVIGKGLSQSYIEKANKLLLERKTTSLSNIFTKEVEVAMGIHPGIRAMMIDPEIFNQTVKTAINDNKTIAETLESNNKILGPQYQKRCKDLIEQLSEAVCLPKQDLVGSVKGDDLTALLNKQKTISYPEMEQLIICESGNPKKTLPLFNDLRMKNAYNRSDLYDRLTQPKDKQTNSFRRLAETKDADAQEIMAQAVEQTRNERVEVKSSNLASNKYMKAGDAAHNEVRSEIVEARSTTAAERVQKTSEVFEDTQTAQNLMPAAVLPNPMTTSVESKASDARSEIREALSGNENPERVEKLLSHTDDNSMKELLRLKEESVQNRQKLLELTSEREKQKLKDLEDKIKLLEQKKEIAAKSTEVPVEDEESSRTRGTNRNVSRDIASIRPLESTGGSYNDNSTTGSTGGGGSASLGSSGSRGGSSAARSRASDAPSATSGTNSSEGVIVVSSSGNSAASGSSQEVSQELINYLSTSEPDLSYLTKLKDSGMVYKYKVMENGVLVEKEILVDYKTLNDDAKKLVEQKLAKQQNPKLAHLDQELMAAKRVHSFQALKIILGEQLKK